MTPLEQCECLTRLLDECAPALALFAAQWSDAPEDCVQEALIQLAGQHPWPDNPVAWLYRVVRNRAISQARSLSRRKRHEALAAQLRPEQADESNGFAEEIAAALESLADDDRELVIARVWGQLTLEQLAAALGISISTVHRRYEAALRNLRKALGDLCPTMK